MKCSVCQSKDVAAKKAVGGLRAHTCWECTSIASSIMKVENVNFVTAVRLLKELRAHQLKCCNCTHEITFGTADHRWRHVLKLVGSVEQYRLPNGEDERFPIQCPNSVAVAEPTI